MKKRTSLLAGCACMIFFSSCLREELPVPAHTPGNVITATVNLDPLYKYQVYYNLKTNSVAGQHLKTIWDLGFETSPAGFHVVLNTAKAMYAFPTGETVFTGVTDTAGFAAGRRWDETSSNPDSTAIGDWRGSSEVYIIDRGYNELGTPQGFRKLQLISVDNAQYTVHVAKLDGSSDTTIIIPKDTAYNFSFLSLGNTAQLVQAEPPKTAWDLVFTQYTHIFYDQTPVTPYLVTGCLLNRYATAAVMDSRVQFSSIDYSSAQQHTLSSAVNAIGYDWKVFSGNTYTTLPQMNYIIRDHEGFFYKLHFIDFYNNSGQKGNPKWEYQSL